MLTVHTSKGLEFPIAYVPFGWDRFDRTDVACAATTAGAADPRRPGPGRTRTLGAAERRAPEDAGETLRLLYVALTGPAARSWCTGPPA